MNTDTVTSHYGTAPLIDKIVDAIQRAGLSTYSLNWSDLAPLDQFHVGGVQDSKELADSLQLDSSVKVLDVGSGLGGPARFLAASFGCHVTGVDLNQPFIEAATMLSAYCGLHTMTDFQVANATTLPFGDSSFDVVWTQHLAMNIENRAEFYAELFRVLKPEGQLAFHDVIVDNGHPLSSLSRGQKGRSLASY